MITNGVFCWPGNEASLLLGLNGALIIYLMIPPMKEYFTASKLLQTRGPGTQATFA